MIKKKILFVLGTRPEAIKLAPVIAAVRQNSALEATVCATGQHRQMFDQVTGLFGITVDHDLNIMTDNQTLFDVTTWALNGLSGLYGRLKPDLIMVQGDTTTVMAASLAAYYARIPLAHVEAGLRSFDVNNPFPEEVNRVIADRVAALHFPPTKLAATNLLKEGIPKERLIITGNTVVDALLQIARQPHQWDDPQLKKFFASSRQTPYPHLILLTAHRRENFGEPLEEICRSVLELVRRYPAVAIIYPAHLNPNVQSVAKSLLGGQERILLTHPLSYRDLAQGVDGSR